MKRIFAILVLTALLLTSCGETPVDIPKMDNNKIYSDVEVHLDIQPREGNPDANYLVDPIFDTEEYLPDYDADLGMAVDQHGFTLFCESEDAYYLVDSYFLYYLDKMTLSKWPFCFKPECTHGGDNWDCGAYIGTCQAIAVYDGRLWWLNDDYKYDGRYTESQFNVYSCALDGIDRRLEFETDAAERIRGLKTNSIGCRAYFHRGYLYIYCPRKKVENAVPVDYIYLLRTPLSGDGKTEDILCERFENLSTSVSFILVGNSLYFTICANSDPDALGYDNWKTANGAYRYDAGTGALDVLCYWEGNIYIPDKNGDTLLPKVEGKYIDNPDMVDMRRLGADPSGNVYFIRGEGTTVRLTESGELVKFYDAEDGGYRLECMYSGGILFLKDEYRSGSYKLVHYRITDYELNVISEGTIDFSEDVDFGNYPYQLDNVIPTFMCVGRDEMIWNAYYDGSDHNDPGNLYKMWAINLSVGIPFDGSKPKVYTDQNNFDRLTMPDDFKWED